MSRLVNRVRYTPVWLPAVGIARMVWHALGLFRGLCMQFSAMQMTLVQG